MRLTKKSEKTQGQPLMLCCVRCSQSPRIDKSISVMPRAVILSAAKDLLAGYIQCSLLLVGFEEILHFVQNDNVY